MTEKLLSALFWVSGGHAALVVSIDLIWNHRFTAPFLGNEAFCSAQCDRSHQALCLGLFDALLLTVPLILYLLKETPELREGPWYVWAAMVSVAIVLLWLSVRVYGIGVFPYVTVISAAMLLAGVVLGWNQKMSSGETQHPLPGWDMVVTDSVRSAMLAEYSALRAEVAARIGSRQQTLAIAAVIFAGLLTFGTETDQEEILLLYPILSFFLALPWAQNDFRIYELGRYIRERLEAKLRGLGWESHLSACRSAQRTRYVRNTDLFALGLFLGTQVSAVMLVVSMSDLEPSEFAKVLVRLDVIAMLATAAFILRRTWTLLVFNINRQRGRC